MIEDPADPVGVTSAGGVVGSATPSGQCLVVVSSIAQEYEKLFLPVVIVRLAHTALSRRDSVYRLSHDCSSSGEENESDLHLGDLVANV